MIRKRPDYETHRRRGTRTKEMFATVLFTTIFLGCTSVEATESQSSQAEPQSEQSPPQSSSDPQPEQQASRVDTSTDEAPEHSEGSPANKYILGKERNIAIGKFAKCAAVDVVGFSEQPRTMPDVGGFTFSEMEASRNIGDPVDEGYGILVHDPTLSGPPIDMRLVIKKVDDTLDPESIAWLYVEAPGQPVVTLSAPNYGPAGFVVDDTSNPRGWTVAVGSSKQSGSDPVVGSGEQVGPTDRQSITVPSSGSKLGTSGELGDVDKLAGDILDLSLETVMSEVIDPKCLVE